MRDLYQAILLTAIFIICTGFTIGLTFAPCYATLCSEEFYARDTRIHIATYYALIASVAIALFLRRFSPACYNLSHTYLTKRNIPIFQKRLTVGALAAIVWILTIILVTTAFWYGPLADFWAKRTDPTDWNEAHVPLIVTGIIGHHADMILGLLLIPVGRNSLLVRVFGLSYGTLLYAHKLLAYGTVIASAAHGIAYCKFWGTYEGEAADSPRRALFEINNPTLTVSESQARGVWNRANLGTGLASFVFMLIVVITALPYLRRRAYNVFYYSHIIFGILIFVGTCVHASTNFYFLLPGLVLWGLEWAWRIFRGETGLSKEVTATLSPASGEWYRINLPVAAQSQPEAYISGENSLEKGAAPSPLQTYYINIPSISRVENHAFTAAQVGTRNTGAVLLFQKVPASNIKRSDKAQQKEWTWRLTRLIDEYMPQHKPREIRVRVEGPYSPVTNGFETADHVICVVGGTGLTGAYSIAQWWRQHRGLDSNSRFSLIWTARQLEAFDLEEWKELCDACVETKNMQIVAHCSSTQGRLDISQYVRDLLTTKSEKFEGKNRQAWMYASGPNSLLTAASDVCIDIQAEIRSARRAKKEHDYNVDVLNHYTADWEV